MPADGEQPLVLVVDDEPASVRAVRRALLDECDVLTAASAAEALTALARAPIGLVISDQRMPGTSGCEFLAQTLALHPDVVRVMLTGYADVETLREAINRAGVYHCLTKPWETRELCQVVRRGLERFLTERERCRLMCELELACARATREAAQRLRLLTMTAHELGTPLHIVVNAIDLARTEGPTPPAGPWLDTAGRAAQWLARGVAQMATAARLESETLTLRREAVDLAALLARLVERVRRLAPGRQVEITTALAEPLMCNCDRRWTEHALWGLLTNAVRFTPDGGWVRIEGCATDDEVVVSVCDGGTGISAEVLDEIFEPFSAAVGNPLFHASGTLEFGTRGLGLGLATVRKVIEAHGGCVRAESARESGSRFSVTLPRAPDAVATRP